jgi:hypothetical protein
METPHKRRDFLKKGILGTIGGLLGLTLAPKFAPNALAEVSPLGQNQEDLLLASKALLERFGILRAWAITEFANDGEVAMDWTVWLPPDGDIDQGTDELARQILQLLGQGT